MKGPKGVGKTMCLLALLCVLAVENTIAVFIIGHNYGSADQMRYLEGLASRFDIVIEPNTIFKDFLKRFIQFARQKYQVLLLMDFDNFSDVRNLVEMVEVVKVAVVAKVVTVLAVSSGRGSNALHLEFPVTISDMRECYTFLPFNDHEVEHFIAGQPKQSC